MLSTSCKRFAIIEPDVLLIAVILFGPAIALPGGTGYQSPPGFAQPGVGSYLGVQYPSAVDYRYPLLSYPSRLNGLGVAGHQQGVGPFWPPNGGVKYRKLFPAGLAPVVSALTTPATLIGTQPIVTSPQLPGVSGTTVGGYRDPSVGTLPYLPGAGMKPKLPYSGLPALFSSQLPGAPFYSGAFPGIGHGFTDGRVGGFLPPGGVLPSAPAAAPSPIAPVSRPLIDSQPSVTSAAVPTVVGSTVSGQRDLSVGTVSQLPSIGWKPKTSSSLGSFYPYGLGALGPGTSFYPGAMLGIGSGLISGKNGLKYGQPGLGIPPSAGGVIPSTTLTTPATLIDAQPTVTPPSAPSAVGATTSTLHDPSVGTAPLSPSTGVLPKAPYSGSPSFSQWPSQLMPSVPFYPGSASSLGTGFFNGKDGKWKGPKNFTSIFGATPVLGVGSVTSALGVGATIPSLGVSGAAPAVAVGGAFPGTIGVPAAPVSAMSPWRPLGVTGNGVDPSSSWQRYPGGIQKSTLPSGGYADPSLYRSYLPSRPAYSGGGGGWPQQYPPLSFTPGAYAKPGKGGPVLYQGSYSGGYASPQYYPSYSGKMKG